MEGNDLQLFRAIKNSARQYPFYCYPKSAKRYSGDNGESADDCG